jgi:acetyltransferase-like isoleucine patch superfamily enzyme
MHSDIVTALRKHQISFMGKIEANDITGWNTPMELEPYVQMRGGRYDVRRVGGFSYFGGRDSQIRFVSSIGRFCSIAQNLIAGPTEHSMAMISSHSALTGSFNKTWPQMFSAFGIRDEQIEAAKKFAHSSARRSNSRIAIGNDVWIGEGVFIGRGIAIGDGAVVAARSTVVKDVPPYTIVGGTPARTIRMRFDEKLVERFVAVKWWDYGMSALAGIDWTDPIGGLSFIEDRIVKGLTRWLPDTLLIKPDGTTAVIARSDRPITQ